MLSLQLYEHYFSGHFLIQTTTSLVPATMSTQPGTYPIIHDVERELSLWLNFQRRINSLSETDAARRVCDGCGEPGERFEPATTDNQLIELPCHCRLHRCCIEDSFEQDKSKFGPDIRCPWCYRFLFRSSDPFLEEWLKELRPADVEDLKEDERSCKICTEAYDTKTEVPLEMSCGHHFGAKCIERWFKPYPNGGVCIF